MGNCCGKGSWLVLFSLFSYCSFLFFVVFLRCCFVVVFLFVEGRVYTSFFLHSD